MGLNIGQTQELQRRREVEPAPKGGVFPKNYVKKVTMLDIYDQHMTKVRKITYFKNMLIAESQKDRPDTMAMRYYMREIWKIRNRRTVYMVRSDV